MRKFSYIVFALFLSVPAFAEDEIEFVAEPEGAGKAPADFLFSGKFSTRNSLDTSFDGREEDVTETLNSLNLSVRAEVALALNFFIEGRFLYWAAAKEPENNAFLLLNGREPRAEFETELLEAYVSYKSPRFSIIAGNQIIGWGGTSFVNPVNQINPLDYRYGILTDEKLPYLPVPAVRIVKSFGIASVEAVFVPFFIPSRYSLAGRDYALFNGQAGAVQMPPVFTYAMGLLDQTVSYKVQPYFFATELPDEIPDNFSGGARIMFDFTDVKLGFSYFYGFDRTPYAVFNKDMALVLGKVFETGFDMAALLSLMADPDETEFRESYQKILDEKIPVEDVYRSSYKRMHSAGFEGSATFGDFNLNLEAAFQPERTFYYSDLTPFRKPCLSSAASLEYNHGTDFDLTLELSYLRLFDIEKGRDLLLIENDMFTFFGALHYNFLEYEKARVGILFMYGVTREDYLIVPSATYKFSDHFHLSLGADIIGGRKSSPGRVFTNNDQVYINGELFF